MELEINHLDLRYTPLRVLDPGRVGRLAASITQDGQQSPVLVTSARVLVDGYHRVAALRELGRDAVDALDLGLSEADALVLSWRLETGRRKTALEEAWMLQELVVGHGRSQSSLAAELRRPRSWVSQRLGLVRALPEAVQGAVREGKVPAEAAQKFLVPMGRASRADCEGMVAALSEPITKRQAERLYTAWRAADLEGRQRLVQQPALFLKADEAVAAVPFSVEEKLIQDFEGVASLCRRARRQVRDVFGRPNTMVQRAWVQAQEAMAALTEEVARAGT